MSHTVKLFERIINHMLRTIVQLGNIHFVFRRGRSTVDRVVDRPLLNTKWMLPNSTIVLSMWFIIRSNSFTVWDISFILQKLLHSSMIPFPLNSSLNLEMEISQTFLTIVQFHFYHSSRRYWKNYSTSDYNNS